MADVVSSPRSPIRSLLIALMFLLSGASALVYEVVWSRQLTTLFGATTYAVATVLTAFMGGLALGSWFFGRRADRIKRPLLVFGLLELGIGLASLAFPTVLHWLAPIAGSLYATGEEPRFLLFSLVRFLIAGGLLLVPTTLMGATLPIMSRAITRDMRLVGRAVGGLYALNTAGAVLGTFSAGFFLLERFGIWGCTVLAACVDGLVALLAVAAGWSLRVADGQQPTPANVETNPADSALRPSPSALRVVLVAYFFSGFVALAYQVAWTRSLLFGFELLKATTYSFAGMLTVFLLGLALGSAIMQAIVDRLRDHLLTFAALQFLLGIFGALTPFLIRAYMPPFFAELNDAEPGVLQYWNAIGNVMVRTALVIGVPTLLMGMTFPLVVRLVAGSLDRLGRDIGSVYAINTCGAIAGSFLGGFVLIPMLGITRTIGLLAAITFAVVIAIIWVHPKLLRARRPVFAVLLLVVAGLFVHRVAAHPEQHPFHPLTIGEKLVTYNEGALATVSVIEDSKGWRTIYVDAVGVAGTDPVLQTDQKSLAHVPMVLLGGKADRVLTVGFGSGGASYSYTLYPDVKHIDAIEITQNVPLAAPSLTAANHGIVYPRKVIEQLRRTENADAPVPPIIPGSAPSAHPLRDYTHPVALDLLTFDPRYRLIIDDARAYLRFSHETYDVIATDCTDLRYKSNANLYDREYFQLCRDRISDRGLVVVWTPLAGLSDEAFRIVVRTFKEVFPEMTVWYFTNQPTHYCLFIGQKGSLRINYKEVIDALALPAIRGDLDEIGLRDPAKLVSCFVTDDRGIDSYVGEGPLNTEDFPIIEFLSPRYGYDSRPIAENMGRLYDVQVPVWDRVVDGNDTAAMRDKPRMAAYQQANDILFQGHAQYRLFNFVEACKFYQEAKKIAPDDESIDRLLDFDELRLLVEADMERPNSRMDQPWINAQWIAHQLTLVYLQQDRPADAASIAGPFARRTPPPSANLEKDVCEVGAALNEALAECYERTGNPERAVQFRKTAEEYRKP